MKNSFLRNLHSFLWMGGCNLMLFCLLAVLFHPINSGMLTISILGGLESILAFLFFPKKKMVTEELPRALRYKFDEIVEDEGAILGTPILLFFTFLLVFALTQAEGGLWIKSGLTIFALVFFIGAMLEARSYFLSKI